MQLVASIRRSRCGPSIRRCPDRYLSVKGGEQTYIDQWFTSIVKPISFYEQHSESTPRMYFYNVDLQGRLFLEETLPKNIATSIKDARFLDFFFRMVRSVGGRDEEIMREFDIAKDEYPFVSPCGKEINFIRPAATPIVFQTFDQDSLKLIYAGSKSQDFKASDLAISEVTGRLYHRCAHMEKATAKTKEFDTYNETNQPQFSLIRSAVVVSLSDQIGLAPDNATGEEADESSGLAFFSDGQEPHSIPWLPAWAEPGDWAMPFSEEVSE